MEKFCLIDGCPDDVQARSLCSHHYYKYRRFGTPLPELRCADCSADISDGNLGRERCGPCADDRLRQLRRERNPRREKVVRSCYRCRADTAPTSRARKLCGGCLQDGIGQCSERDCDRRVRARGVCGMHYKRMMRASGAWEPEPWDDRRRNNYHARRALKAGAAAGPAFSNADVFERDGWVCGLCSEPVDRGVSYPDPLSASLDHVVPLSRGGAHSFENVQLAHLVCNVRKGAGEDVVLTA